MTNQAIAWMQAQHSLTPDKPFFVYFATGALHAPHHVPKAYIDRYKGKFDQGWDALREETFARQKKMGVIPQNAELTKRPKEIPSWDSQTPDQKKIEARQMETFAGFGEHTDEQVGRLVQALQEMGVMDNTLFIYIVGDNGASAEGGPEGAYNEMMALERDHQHRRRSTCPTSKSGAARRTFPHYAIGWAWAGDTPFQWTKQIASHYGGTTNGVVIHWPARIQDRGGIRSQFTYVTDIAPTVLEAASLPFPESVNGTAQRPFDGTSMAYTFDDPEAAGDAHDAVLRDVRQPRHLSRRLDRGRAPLDSLADGAAAAADRRRLGAVPHGRGLQPGARSRGAESGEAEGDAGPLHEGGDREPRAADRRPPVRALRCQDRRAAPT